MGYAVQPVETDWISFESVGVLSSNTAAQNTTALQTALDAVSGTGQRRTFYGEGQYALNGPVSIPSDITILGNSTGLKGSPNTARFIITDTANPVFKMNSRTTIDGWVFDYPNQPLTTTTPSTSLITYPATIVQDDAFNEQLVVRNCTFVGASKCISFGGATGNQDIHIENVYGYPMLGRMVAIERCFDIPYISKVHVNPGAGKSYRTLDGTSGLPTSEEVIDYTITNASAEATILINATDEFVLSQCFAFGVRTAFQFTDSYGSCTQCNADIVQTGFLVQPNTDRKAVQLIGCSGIPSGGTAASRNLIVFSGAGGSLIVNGLNVQLGVNSVVPSSSAAANSIIQISGSGDQDVLLNNIIANSTGTYTYDIQKSNTSAVLRISAFDVKSTVTNAYNAIGSIKNFHGEESRNGDATVNLVNGNSGTAAVVYYRTSNGSNTMTIGVAGTGYTTSSAVAANNGFVSASSKMVIRTTTASDISFAPNSVEAVAITSAGGLNLNRTITAAGTTGAQTINKLSGTVNFAAGTSSLVVTNSLVTANSIVLCVIRTNDSTAQLKNVVPSAGAFTINLTGNTTGETSVGFLVLN